MKQEHRFRTHVLVTRHHHGHLFLLTGECVLLLPTQRTLYLSVSTVWWVTTLVGDVTYIPVPSLRVPSLPPETPSLRHLPEPTLHNNPGFPSFLWEVPYPLPSRDSFLRQVFRGLSVSKR